MKKKYSYEKKVLLSAAQAASKVLMSYFLKNPKITVKKNKTLVSEADMAANKAIIKEIKKSFPNHNIISEESQYENNNSDFTWIMDPLDGTHNFLRGIPIFGTSIALKHKNEIVLGAIYMPVLGIRMVAEKGKGAYANGKKLEVSKNRELEHSFLLFEFAVTHRKKKLAVFERMIEKRFDLRNFGAAVYHLYLVASGQSEAYIIYHTNEWDVAAGLLMITEAGGKYTGIDSKAADSTTGHYIASNGKIHSKLAEFLKKH